MLKSLKNHYFDSFWQKFCEGSKWSKWPNFRNLDLPFLSEVSFNRAQMYWIGLKCWQNTLERFLERLERYKHPLWVARNPFFGISMYLYRKIGQNIVFFICPEIVIKSNLNCTKSHLLPKIPLLVNRIFLLAIFPTLALPPPESETCETTGLVRKLLIG